MTAITASTVKELREKTGLGMMECKKALTETGGNIDEAIKELRKKGMAKADKKSGRTASEGAVAVLISEDGKKGVLAELNCETDFASKNPDFQALAKRIAGRAINILKSSDENPTEKVLNSECITCADKPVMSDEIKELVAVIGENLNLRRVASLELDGNGIIASYLHNVIADGLAKIGVLVAIESDGDKSKLEAFGKQLAMHVAAAKPDALNIEDVDSTNLEKEKEILKAQALASGKPENIVEKMMEGRIRKYYEEIVLTEQVFVIDGKIPVKEAIENAEKDIGSPIKVTGYQYFLLGEGVK